MYHMNILIFINVLLLLILLHFVAYPCLRPEDKDNKTIFKSNPIYPMQKFLENILIPFFIAGILYLSGIK